MSDYPETHDELDEPLSGAGWGLRQQSVDPETGEIIDDESEIVEAEVIDELSSSREIELMPTVFAQHGERAVQLFRDPEAIRTLTHDARLSLLGRLRGMAERQRALRDEGRPTAAVLAPEITLMADAHDTLSALSAVFKAGADEARVISGEIVVEIADDVRKSNSVRVGDKHGTDVKVSRTVQTEVRVDEDEIVDVLVASLIAKCEQSDQSWEGPAAYARGARDAIEQYRRLAASHSFKTSALDAYGRELDAAEQHALSIRLGHAYGRVSKGETVKIERVERKRGA